MPEKSFGPRYGRTLKKQFDLIERLQRAKHKCPFCQKNSVKRIAVGIWECRKCDKKFTGKAYNP